MRQGEASVPARESLSFEFSLADLGHIRRVVTARAMASGLSRSRAADLALAASEIASNAIIHGRPPTRLRLWEEDGELICEVRDAGDGIKDPLAGRRKPRPGASRGRGLWLSRLICRCGRDRQRHRLHGQPARSNPELTSSSRVQPQSAIVRSSSASTLLSTVSTPLCPSTARPQR